ncbi:hypothetical protein BHE90_006514 [Fusarium euwallaceae]|uniref:AA1-like domain-containing protein n=1 Tax=Fusarium euwallaceae TaxID=1147111 RepID=A0A430LTD7_9HYPO|nr:hypothetical protein BHE90_006514 [Fusarium euwallaceae]
MVLALGVALVALISLCAAKDTASTEVAQRLAVIFEKSLITGTVLTSAYDIEDKDKKFHCAASSNKLTISDLKLDVEFDVDDHGHGTLRVSESHFVIDQTSKTVSGISCSTSYSKDHVRAECLLPLDHHHKPLGRPSAPAKPVGHVHKPHRPQHLHRPHHPHHPHHTYPQFHHRVGPQRVHDPAENTAYAPVHHKVERPYPVKPDPVHHPVHDDQSTRPYARQPGYASS